MPNNVSNVGFGSSRTYSSYECCSIDLIETVGHRAQVGREHRREPAAERLLDDLQRANVLA